MQNSIIEAVRLRLKQRFDCKCLDVDQKGKLIRIAITTPDFEDVPVRERYSLIIKTITPELPADLIPQILFAGKRIFIPLRLHDHPKPSKQIIGEPKLNHDPDFPQETVIRNRQAYETVRNLITAAGGTEQDLVAMIETGVFKRMRFGIHPYYEALALGKPYTDRHGNRLLEEAAPSPSVINLILPRGEEVLDLSGDKDPSNQMKYSRLDGTALHKYNDIVLAYISVACSAHCRYCYREDLFSKETRAETGKSVVKNPENLTRYIRRQNDALQGKESAIIDGVRRYRTKEVLLSGGDAMNLMDHKLYEYMAAAAEAGVDTVRIGTKELAFRPERFDASFIETLREFHRTYPKVRVYFASHFTHPDEFLQRDTAGHYVRTGQSNRYQWIPVVREAVRSLLALPFVSIENQTPMIRSVNDSADALRILHSELARVGIKPKYIFGCRHIRGHAAFSVPIEEAFSIYTESQKGLSDAARSRFALSTEFGKMEVIGMTDEMPLDLQLPDGADRGAVARSILGSGLIIFKIHRAPGAADSLSELVIARRNPEALWINDYDDRLIYDGRARNGVDKFNGLAAGLTGLSNNKTLLEELSDSLLDYAQLS